MECGDKVIRGKLRVFTVSALEHRVEQEVPTNMNHHVDSHRYRRSFRNRNRNEDASKAASIGLCHEPSVPSMRSPS